MFWASEFEKIAKIVHARRYGIQISLLPRHVMWQVTWCALLRHVPDPVPQKLTKCGIAPFLAVSNAWISLIYETPLLHIQSPSVRYHNTAGKCSLSVEYISRNCRHKIYLRHRSPWVYCEASDPLFCVACRYILSRWWLSVLFSVVVHEIRVQNFLILVNLRSKTRTLQFTTCHQKTWLFSSPCKFLYCPPLFPSSPSLPPAPPGMDSYSSSP